MLCAVELDVELVAEIDEGAVGLLASLCGASLHPDVFLCRFLVVQFHELFVCLVCRHLVYRQTELWVELYHPLMLPTIFSCAIGQNTGAILYVNVY